MNDELNFDDLETVTLPVAVAGKKYTLREASGEAAAKYRNVMLEGTTLGPDGKPVSIRGLADAEALLVSLCLFAEDGRNVHLAIVKAWPNRIVKKLYDTAVQVSDLGEDEEATAKNEPSGIGIG